jgi:DNA-binding SARP family transcriptional activator
MLGAASGGQMSGVHRVYAECRRKLADDLGVAPDPRTIELFRQLVDGCGSKLSNQAE